MLPLSLLCVVVYATQACEAYKALVVFPVAAKSHAILGEGIVRHLLANGHEVTYMTPYPKPKKVHPSLREIDVSSPIKLIPENTLNIEKLMNKEVPNVGMISTMKIFFKIYVTLFENKEAQKLLNDPKENFDVVIVEWMFSDLISGVAAIFNCPFIWVSTINPHWMVLKLIDEAPNPAYMADAKSSIEVPFTFVERVHELLKMTMTSILQTFYVSRIEEEEYERLVVPIIKKRGHKVPVYDELRYNASLMLGNSYDLQKLLDNAKYGLIYFSMGSNLRSQHMPPKLKSSLTEMFGKLKQTVLWKFEEDLPNRPNNLHIVQWAPQQSILAHPNCILFITHGGLLSTTEAIHFGKPIIGIPVFGDQFTNVDRSVRRGFAKRVDLSYTMADELGKAINDITAGPSYSAKAKELSLVYHDRPVAPGKELAHWVEHVVRTGGAPHLRSPALMVPWYQKCYLDLAVLVTVILYMLKLFMKKLISHCSRKPVKRKTQ